MAYAQPNTISGEISAAPHNANYAYIINALNAYDGANLSAGTVARAAIAADAINGTKIADDSIDSEHIVDGSVDAAHLATGVANENLKLSGHIVLTPDTSKLVKFSVTRKEKESTATYVNDNVIVTGWTSVEGNGTTKLTQGVTFPVTFSNVPIVMVTTHGNLSGSPATLDLWKNSDNASGQAVSISTTGFTAIITRASDMTSGNFWGISYIAIGTLA